MRYELRRSILSAGSILSIADKEFASIWRADRELRRLLTIEQRYDILIGNYLDLERQIFHCNSEHVVREYFNESHLLNAMSLIDRCIGNFLSSARAFIDQASNGAEPNDVPLIQGYFADQYDSSLAYRTMEALRNYTQHCGLPTQFLHFNGKWHDKKDLRESRLVHSVVPALNTETLRKEKHFKRAILAELESLAQEHPIMPMLREYLGALSHVLAHLRGLYASRKHDWIGDLQKPVFRYCEYDGNSLGTGVIAVAYSEDSELEEEIELLSDLTKTLSTLQQVNRPLVNLEKRQMTS